MIDFAPEPDTRCSTPCCESAVMSIPPSQRAGDRVPICKRCLREQAGGVCAECGRAFEVDEYPRSAIDVYMDEKDRTRALCIDCWAGSACPP